MTEHVADPRWERENLPATMSEQDLTDYTIDALCVDVAEEKFQPAMRQAIAGFARAMFLGEPERIPTPLALAQALAVFDDIVAALNAIAEDRVGRA